MMPLPVQSLRRFGHNRRAVIVGGGHSLQYLDAKHMRDAYTISCNLHAVHSCDMVIFHDASVADELRKIHILPAYVMAPHTLIDRCQCATHFYKASDTVADSTADIEFGDTGYHALQIADQIMGFNEILLFGFDYETRGLSYHHSEIVSDKDKLDKFNRHSVGVVLPKLQAYKSTARIFTASKNGRLPFPII